MAEWWRLDKAFREIEDAVILLQALKLQVQQAGLKDVEDELDRASGDAMLAMDRIQALQQQMRGSQESPSQP